MLNTTTDSTLLLDAVYERTTWGVAKWLAVATVGHLAAAVLIQNTPILKQAGDWWGVLDCVFGLPYYCVMSYYAVKGAWGLESDRVDGVSTAAEEFVMMFAAKTISHMFVVMQQKMTASFRATTLLHHVASIICLTSTVLNQRLEFYAALDGISETTNIFLSVLYLFKYTSTATSYSTVYSVNGVCLWLSFLFARIILFPVWLMYFYSDYTSGRFHSGVTTAELVGYATTTVLLLVMSINWFIPITKGLLKVAFSQKEDWDMKKQQ